MTQCWWWPEVMNYTGYQTLRNLHEINSISVVKQGKSVTGAHDASQFAHKSMQVRSPQIYIWINQPYSWQHQSFAAQIAKFMGPTWGPPGSCRPQMGPMLAPWTLLLGRLCLVPHRQSHGHQNDAMVKTFDKWCMCAWILIRCREVVCFMLCSKHRYVCRFPKERLTRNLLVKTNRCPGTRNSKPRNC